jgi:DNA repair exonuclease SbcCD nuclease subunit
LDFRFVHAADLHLDTPFQGIGRLNSQVQSELRDASLNAFDDLIEFCIDSGAAFLVIAGDVYDSAERSVRAQLRVVEGLKRLSEHQIATFIVHGNHDPMDGWSAIREWPERVHIFSSHDVESRPVEIGGSVIATVHGMSYPTRDVGENLALRFRRDPASPGFHVGLLHCTVGTTAEHESYCPCEMGHLRNSGMDYWALGHIHQRRILLESKPCVAYSGNLQGRSLKPSEQGAKGALLVTVGSNEVRSVSFKPLDRVRFAETQLDVSGLADLSAVLQALVERTMKLRAEHPGRGLLLRGLLAGRGRLHQDLQRPGAANELLEELQAATHGYDPFVWWTEIKDRTRSELDLSAIRLRGDFSAELVNLANELLDDELQEATIANGAELPAFLKSVLSTIEVEESDWPTLLIEAQETALELLDQGVSS